MGSHDKDEGIYRVSLVLYFTFIYIFQHAKSLEGNAHKLLNPEETRIFTFMFAKSLKGNAHKLLNPEWTRILYSIVIQECGSMDILKSRQKTHLQLQAQFMGENFWGFPPW